MSIKVVNKLTDKAFEDISRCFKEMLPEGNKIPENYYQTRKLLCEVGLGYEQIDVCRYDCSIFYGDNANVLSCPVCQCSRYIRNKIPHKRLRWFPLKDRLKHLFSSKHTSKDMRWHKEVRKLEPGILRHPADGMAWKHFDNAYPDFSADSRSVRMGLASDGFNPFSNLTSTYSLWPVILIPYNMPPWASPNGTNYLMSLLIPGPKSPGKYYDVFLKPLIEELKELWDGVDAYDSYGGCIFKLRAAVLWTISDFPGHRCYLNANHSWRKSREYDGSRELRGTPRTFTGDDILKQLEEVPNKCCKVVPCTRDGCLRQNGIWDCTSIMLETWHDQMVLLLRLILWTKLEHRNILQERGLPNSDIEIKQREEFPLWFQKKVSKMQVKKSRIVSDDLYSLSQDPLERYNSYQSCIVNGVRFRCKAYDDALRTQCSGVCTEGDHDSDDIVYYGTLTEILQLSYQFNRKVFLFRCKWYNSNPKGRSIYVDNNMTSVNTSTDWYPTEPFILATQAQQVFYLRDIKRGSDWRFVQKVNHRNLYDIPELCEVSNYQPSNDVFQEEESIQLPPFKPIEDLIESSSLVRKDVASLSVSGELVDKLIVNNEKQPSYEEDDSEETELSEGYDDGDIFLNDSEILCSSDDDSDETFDTESDA
ncbi:uncharacterized protein LOC141663841 isoform X2 [Apium graveolens]|uniref:uncharacterized protein LOC141663841 isoform X2 n=1 Tax=Apium graveolens TaxID=4045 RepID=UPI003D7B8EE5